MENEEERRPVMTAYMRRDCSLNPEFLDMERAYVRFWPLIASLTKGLMKYCGRYDAHHDAEDMQSIVSLEFARLIHQYDPSYGVDFPGYIKMNLSRRVLNAVMSSKKKTDDELLAFASEIFNDPMDAMPDRTAERELELVEYRASVPVDRIEDDECREIVRDILSGMGIDDLAAKFGTKPRAMALRIESVGRQVRELMERIEAEGDDGEEAQA